MGFHAGVDRMEGLQRVRLRGLQARSVSVGSTITDKKLLIRMQHSFRLPFSRLVDDDIPQAYDQQPLVAHKVCFCGRRRPKRRFHSR